MLGRRTLLLLLMVFAAAIETTAQQKAPDLSFKDIDGKTIRLSDFRGKVLLLNFWATWCVPCRTEIPDLVKKQRRYRIRGLRILGITYPPEQRSEVRSFTRKFKINYPVIIGSKETKQAFTSSETLPLTVVIDGEGDIREIIEGIMYPDEFDEKVKPLLPNATLPTNRLYMPHYYDGGADSSDLWFPTVENLRNLTGLPPITRAMLEPN